VCNTPTGRVADSRLVRPLRQSTTAEEPRRNDLFHGDVPADYIAAVFAVMAATPQHTYQVLTKRQSRMRSLLADECRCPGGHAPGVHFRSMMSDQARRLGLDSGEVYRAPWPLPNLLLGVSVEDQKHADLRIPALLATPAAARFLSCEPLLGHVSLCEWLVDCPHLARCGAEGPVAELGRMPGRWRCDWCGSVLDREGACHASWS